MCLSLVYIFLHVYRKDSQSRYNTRMHCWMNERVHQFILINRLKAYLICTRIMLFCVIGNSLWSPVLTGNSHNREMKLSNNGVQKRSYILCPHNSTNPLSLYQRLKAPFFKRFQLSGFKGICMDLSSFQHFKNSFITINFSAFIKHSIPTFSSLQRFEIYT